MTKTTISIPTHSLLLHEGVIPRTLAEAIAQHDAAERRAREVREQLNARWAHRTLVA